MRQAIGFAIDREAIVSYLRRGFAAVAVGIVPPMSWAFERERLRLPSRSRPRRGGCSTRPGFPIPTATARGHASGLTLKTSTSEVYRVQAAAIQQDLARVGIAVDVRSQRVRDALRRRRRAATSRCTRCSWSASPIPTCCAACSLEPGAAGGLEPRLLPQRRVDRLIERRRGRRRRRARGGRCTRRRSG